MEASPKWKKPKRIVLRKKKSIESESEIGISPSKRINPFGPVSNSPRSKRLLRHRSEISKVSTDLLSPSPPAHETLCSPVDIDTPVPRYTAKQKSTCIDSNASVQRVKIEANHSDETVESTRLDFSLRTSATFSSIESNFDWCCPKNDVHFSEGLSIHTGDHRDSDHARSVFASKCQLWIHPHLPTFVLFPRIVADFKISKKPSNNFSPEMKEILHSEWTQSLDSLFVSLKLGRCPYFYICTHAMTMLFTSRSTLECPGTTFTATIPPVDHQLPSSCPPSINVGTPTLDTPGDVDKSLSSSSTSTSSSPPSKSTADTTTAPPDTPKRLPRKPCTATPTSSSANITATVSANTTATASPYIRRPGSIALTPSVYASGCSLTAAVSTRLSVEGVTSVPEDHTRQHPSPPLTPCTPQSQEPPELSLVVMMTPTTRGFRDYLTSHDIKFKMPLYKNTNNPLTNSQISLSEDSISNSPMSCSPALPVESESKKCPTQEDEDEITNTDEGAHTWLTEMGLDKNAFKSLAPDKVKLDRSQTLSIDNRPKSIILLDDKSSILGFINMLHNVKSPSVVSATGIQSGIPPTLLSPVAFRGAYNKLIKMSTHSIRDGHAVRKTLRMNNGPLLPSSYMEICKMLESRGHNYQVTSSTSEFTSTFNDVIKLITSSQIQ